MSTSICSFHHCYLCLPRLHENHLFDKGRTIRKVRGDGEVGKKQKKNHARENVPPKNSFKVKPKEKKSWKGRARYFTKTRMIPCLPETSSSVSGFCHVFIHSATRKKSFFLAALPLVSSAFGRHGRFPPHARQ